MKKEIVLLAGALFIGLLSNAQTDAPPPPPQPPVIDLPVIAKDSFMMRNPDVVKIEWYNGSRLTIVKKNGVSKTYDLSDEKVVEQVRKEYGALPKPPPPPPAPPVPEKDLRTPAAPANDLAAPVKAPPPPPAPVKAPPPPPAPPKKTA